MNIKLSISKKIMLLAIIPCLLIGIIVSIIGANLLETNMTREIERALQSSAYSISQTITELEFKEEINNTLANFYEKTSIDATIFQGNKRIASTIDNAVGTSMDEKIYVKLQNKADYFATDALVNGEEYFGYYIPFFTNGQYTGAVFTGVSQEEANAEIWSGVMSLVIIVALITVFSIIIAFIVARFIVGKIKAISGVIEALSNNNLNITTNNKYKNNNDEIEVAYNQIQNFSFKLCEIIKDTKSISKALNMVSDELNKNAETASTSTNEISLAVQNVAEGAESQASDTQIATEMVSEMGVNIDSIINDTEMLKEMADKMTYIKNNTLKDVSDVKIINDKIKADISEVNMQMDITNKSIDEISRITSVIQDIAEQTNLLSLNASIEAAHAGDSGKGFAVVANEIRNLAEQSSNSVKDIERMINGLLENYALIIKKMAVTSENINKQSKKIECTEKSFTELGQNIIETTTQIDSITSATKRLNMEKAGVIDTIHNLSAVSEENSAAAEEVTAGIEGLNTIVSEVAETSNIVNNNANMLFENISVFRVE